MSALLILCNKCCDFASTCQQGRHRGWIHHYRMLGMHPTSHNRNIIFSNRFTEKRFLQFIFATHQNRIKFPCQIMVEICTTVPQTLVAWKTSDISTFVPISPFYTLPPPKNPGSAPGRHDFFALFYLLKLCEALTTLFVPPNFYTMVAPLVPKAHWSEGSLFRKITFYKTSRHHNLRSIKHFDITITD